MIGRWWIGIACAAATSQFRESAFAFGGLHLALIHPKVVRDLMPHGVHDVFFEFGDGSRHAFVRTLENGDLVGPYPGVEDTALGKWAALIQTEQSRARRFLLHYDENVV